MAVANKRALLGLHLVLLCAVVLLTWWRNAPVVHGFTSPFQQPPPITLPHAFNFGKGSYWFEGLIDQGFTTPTSLHLEVDDCIESMALDGAPFFNFACKGSEHIEGVVVPLPKLTPGVHKLGVKISDLGTMGRLEIREAHGLGAWKLAVIFMFGAFMMLLCHRRGLRMGWAWLGVVAVITMVQYRAITGPLTRQHDVHGHREYIQYLLQHQSLPDVKLGWESWQPPLYYVTAAFWTRFTSLFVELETFESVQSLSGLLYLLVFVLTCLLWQQFEFPRQRSWLGPVLVALMPAHVFMSARENNDAAMPIFGLLITALAWRYSLHARRRDVAWMALVMVLAVMTKTSALSLVAGGGLCMMFADHATLRPWKDRLLRYGAVGLPTLLWLGFWFNRNHNQTGQWMYVNDAVGEALRVPNTAFRFFALDIPAYLADHHFNTINGKMRESAPTSLAASLLTGEYSLDEITPFFTSFLRASFLPVILVFVFGLFTRARPWMPRRPHAVAATIFITHALFMASYNYRYPFACNQDARLWAPAYVPAALVFTWGHEAVTTRFSGLRGMFFRAAPYVFVTFLVVFYGKLL